MENTCLRTLKDMGNKVLTALNIGKKMYISFRKSTTIFKGLTSYVNVIDVIRGRCLIHVTDELLRYCIVDDEFYRNYITYVVAHEIGHCLTLHYLFILAFTLTALLIYLIILSLHEASLLHLLFIAFIVKSIHFLRLLSEYLADKVVVKVYGNSYIKFLETLSNIERVLSIPLRFKVLMKVLNQPTSSERLSIILRPSRLILKLLVL